MPARDAIAIHTGAKGTAGATVTVTFEETANTTFGEVSFYYIFMRRSIHLWTAEHLLGWQC